MTKQTQAAEWEGGKAIDYAADSPGPLHGIPDFLRRIDTPEEAARRMADWCAFLGEQQRKAVAVRAADVLRTTTATAYKQQLPAKAIILNANREAAREMAARSYLEVGDPITAKNYLMDYKPRAVVVADPLKPVHNPRGPSGPRLDAMTEAEHATIDQYFATAFPDWKIIKQGGTPTFFLRRGSQCLWVEPIFRARLTTKQVAIISEMCEAGLRARLCRCAGSTASAWRRDMSEALDRAIGPACGSATAARYLGEQCPLRWPRHRRRVSGSRRVPS